MKPLFLLALALPLLSEEPQPVFLKNGGEANAIPQTVRAGMLAAEQKVIDARLKFLEWSRADPGNGYQGAVEFRWMKFLGARANALEAIRAVARHDGLSSKQRKIVNRWQQEAQRHLPSLNQSKAKRTPRLAFFCAPARN